MTQDDRPGRVTNEMDLEIGNFPLEDGKVIGQLRAARYGRDGIPLNDETIEDIVATASRLGVDARALTGSHED